VCVCVYFLQVKVMINNLYFKGNVSMCNGKHALKAILSGCAA